jgi:hypothetical protein
MKAIPAQCKAFYLRKTGSWDTNCIDRAEFFDDDKISNEDLEKAMAEIKKIMEQRKK